jgi:hypothetical protein
MAQGPNTPAHNAVEPAFCEGLTPCVASWGNPVLLSGLMRKRVLRNIGENFVSLLPQFG